MLTRNTVRTRTKYNPTVVVVEHYRRRARKAWRNAFGSPLAKAWLQSYRANAAMAERLEELVAR
jgi:hypothetical protein